MMGLSVCHGDRQLSKNLIVVNGGVCFDLLKQTVTHQYRRCLQSYSVYLRTTKSTGSQYIDVALRLTRHTFFEMIVRNHEQHNLRCWTNLKKTNLSF